MDVFFLGAGASQLGRLPSALKAISKNRKALDWQLQSLERTEINKINFIGGYHVQEIVAQYPELNYTIVPDWQHNSVVYTLLQAPFRSGQEALILYSDTLFRPKIIEQFSEVKADVVVGVDSHWLTRFSHRSEADIESAEVFDIVGYPQFKGVSKVEFTGLVKLSPNAIEVLKSLDLSDVRDLLQVINIFEQINLEVVFYDVEGQWTEFNSDFDIAHFILGTKSETLYRLFPLVKESIIGEQVSFTVSQWRQDSLSIITKIQSRFKGQRLVVRSSSFAEDCWSKSHAGGFESVLNVDSREPSAISKAVEDVVSSYHNSATFDQDQILVQAHLSEVQMSGVVFTRSLETGAPYYRINFDDKTQSTESVTSGSGAHLRTVVVSKSHYGQWSHLDQSLQMVLRGVVEIEELLSYDKLDIEFAIDNKSRLHIFQVRPIAVNHKNDSVKDQDIKEVLDHCVNAFKIEQLKTFGVVGHHTYFGVMPDWNPAEIIGVKPKPLAYSLYRYLIADKIWAEQRAAFGYRDVRQYPLIRTFAGQPYVNVRSSLNSFIPANVDEAAAERICDAYLAVLKDNPQFHDKLEFEVAFTVFTPDFDEKAQKRLLPFGVSDADIDLLKAGLIKITQNAFDRLSSDICGINELTVSRERVLRSEITDLQKAMLLLEECRSHGTLAFAHAARAGFVAMTFLNSLVSSGVLSQSDKEQFLSSFKTVAGDFESDALAVINGKMTQKTYEEIYGHLRPGTYDLTAEAYWENPRKYLFAEHVGETRTGKSVEAFELEEIQTEKINRLLKKMGLILTAKQLMTYCQEAIQAREFVKFEFSRNLSKALDLIISFGATLGLSRKKIAFLSLENLKEYLLGLSGKNDLKEIIKLNKKKFRMTEMLELPQLILSENDFYAFERNLSEPNYITSQSVVADSVCLSDDPESIEGKIVFIEHADPGYDWMFTHHIAGLITKYGGANSHMAIRSAELNLPAAIGVGDKIYDELKSAVVIRLNCIQKQIIRIK